MSPTFRSLRNRNYRLFAGGQLISLTGTWMQTVGQDWLVLELTHSGTALGITTALQFVPMVLFGMYGGIIADRYPKRRVLMVTQAMQGLLALAMGILVATGAITPEMIYVFAFLLGTTSAVDIPSRQSFVIEMVGPQDVTNAVALNSATFNSARIIGPAAAAVVIKLIGIAPVFFANSLSYVAVLASLYLMRESELLPARRVERGPGQLRAGVKYVMARKDLLLPMVLVGLIGMFALNFQLTLALMARTGFESDAGTYGLLSSVLAAGSLSGALFSARRRGAPRQRVLVGGAIALGLLEALVGVMPTLPLFAAMLVPTGCVIIVFVSAANSIVQLGAGEEMRGRVMALYGLVFLGGTPIGGPLMGWLGEHVGPRAPLIVGGLSSAACGVVIGWVLLRHSDKQLREYRPRWRVRRAAAPVTYDVAR